MLFRKKTTKTTNDTDYLEILSGYLQAFIQIPYETLRVLPSTIYEDTRCKEGWWYSRSAIFAGSKSMSNLQTLFQNPKNGNMSDSYHFSEILGQLTESRRKSANQYIGKMLEAITNKNDSREWNDLITHLTSTSLSKFHTLAQPSNGTERVIALMYCHYIKEGLTQGFSNIHTKEATIPTHLGGSEFFI